MRHTLLLLIAAISLPAHIELLIPADTTAGAAGFTLRARGTNYESGEYLLWNGTPLETTFVSEQELTAFIPARLVANPGTVTVTLAGYNSVQFRINPPPVITTESPLPAGTPNSSYAKVLDRTGGSAPFRWEIASGTVPPGLGIDAVNGLLTGTPRESGTYEFVVRLTDRVAVTTTKPFTLVIGRAVPAEPSCAITPRNMLLAAHHPSYHENALRVPDHPVQVVVTAGSSPLAGVSVDLSASRAVFASGTSATGITNTSGSAGFAVNPPAAGGFDRTDLTASFVRNNILYRCSGTIVTGAGMLSSVRERLTAAAGPSMARLHERFDADYRKFAGELFQIGLEHPRIEPYLMEARTRFEPLLRASLSGEQVHLRRGELAKIERTLDAIRPYASPELRAVIADWNREFRRARPKVSFEPPAAWEPGPFVAGKPPALAGMRRLSFEANAGQAGPGVLYLARGIRQQAWFTSDGLILGHPPGDVIRVSFPGGRMRKPEVADRAAAVTNWLVGIDPKKWRTGIPHFERLEYRQVYPKVDLVFYGDEGSLRYDFVAAVGADLSRIAIAFEGVREVEPLESGELRLHHEGGAISLGVPYVYQVRDGRQHAVSARYRSRGAGRIGFELAAYDPALPVVIDPVISYGSFAGGSGEDGALALAVDAQGSAYMAGFSGTTDVQAFVTKLSPDGSRILYTTYFGGSGTDIATGVAVDSAGAAYVSGSTTSANFPAAGFQNRYGGGPVDSTGDGFLVKLDPSGTSVVYGSYIGGSGADAARGVAVDSSGNAYVTGFSASADFPVRNALQPAHRSGTHVRTDAFVSKVNAAGNALVYSTYLGGRGDDAGMAIAIDSAGNAYVTGSAQSADFPVVNPLQVSRKSESDAFVSKLTAAGSALVYSTFLGGSADDSGSAIAIDASGAAYVAGVTGSADFPLRGAAQSRFGSADGLGFDAFAVKLAASGDTLVYGTYLGGSGVDIAHGIAVDAAGAAHVVGETASSDFPVTGPLHPAGSGTDSFFTKIAPSGASFETSTYLGGQALDAATGVALDRAGNVYLAGSTASADHATTPGASSSRLAGRSDAFAIKISPGATVPLVEAMPAARVARGLAVAPESIVRLTGSNLATREESSEQPQEVQGSVSVQILDGAGVTRSARIYSASPTRIDLVLPSEIAPGTARAQVQHAGQTIATGSLRVAPVAPGLFTENGRGSGPPRGWAVRTGGDGEETVLPLGRCVPGGDPECEPLELEMSGPVTLTLLATGVRGRASLEEVQAAAGGVEIPVISAEAQGEYPGYDQIVLGPLPEALRDRGVLDLVVRAGGEESNAVRIRVK